MVIAEVRDPRLASPDLLASIARAVAEHHGVRASSVGLLHPRTIPKTTSGKLRHCEARECWVAGKGLQIVLKSTPASSGRSVRRSVLWDSVLHGGSNFFKRPSCFFFLLGSFLCPFACSEKRT